MTVEQMHACVEGAARQKVVEDDAERLNGPAVRIFFTIADAWRLSEDEQLSLLALSSKSTLRRWKAGTALRLHRDTLERISHVLAIFKAINILLPVPDRADAWLRAPNYAPLFAGGTAVQRMVRGNVSDLYVVRQYLDAQLQAGDTDLPLSSPKDISNEDAPGG
ncbi:antitoxin Xre-like helix-turn-helix domain-containing protein [Sphingobium sp. RSMS]|uniref:antitoxin Xre-like helix-turn-helix domain-containing protein n=1 Tax=Sphingobium sp. RSMS TaxID=520734 RepID=UPI00292A54F9|nr:antitoxin Xre-like helix-turn-helix domain-containing protein [Sphingobium sp. RSMS]